MSADSKLICSRKIVCKNEKTFSRRCKWIFLLKIVILCVRGIRKKFPSLRHEVLPLVPPTEHTYTGCDNRTFTPSTTMLCSRGSERSIVAPCTIRFYENACLCICCCIISRMFWVHLHSSLHWNRRNYPNLSVTNLQLNFLRFYENPFIS